MAEAPAKAAHDALQVRGNAPPAPLPAAPELMRVVYDHGFIEDGTGTHRYWKAGQLVKDAGEIALLKSRGVMIERAG